MTDAQCHLPPTHPRILTVSIGGFTGDPEDNFTITPLPLPSISPSDLPWKYTTEDVRINDIIFCGYMQFSKDLSKDIGEEIVHARLVPGGFQVVKYTRALVINKTYNGNLNVSLLSTFPTTSKEEMQQRTVLDDVTNEEVPFLNDYVHVVSVDHPGRSEDWPGCWNGDARIYYRSLPGCDPGVEKDSFAELQLLYPISDGVPLKILGRIADVVSREKLNAAVDAAMMQGMLQRERALEKVID